MVGRAPPFVAGVAVITIIAGCTSSSKASQTTVISTPTTAATTSASPPTSPTATSHPADGGSTFTMPNVIGKVLQDAQDEIQRVSGNPLFITSSTDATGQGRHQVLDRNWKVCSQNVPAGQQVSAGTHITFSVVKLDESCP
jgi:beta-lactam-binding protein with PASTA domain